MMSDGVTEAENMAASFRAKDAARSDVERMAFEYWEQHGEPKSFEEAWACVEYCCRQVAIDRHKKYDNGNGTDNISEFGEIGVFIRCFGDKRSRLKGVYFDKDGNPRSKVEREKLNMKDESIDDAWLDTANYAKIALMKRLGIWGLPIKGE